MNIKFNSETFALPNKINKLQVAHASGDSRAIHTAILIESIPWLFPYSVGV